MCWCIAASTYRTSSLMGISRGLPVFFTVLWWLSLISFAPMSTSVHFTAAASPGRHPQALMNISMNLNGFFTLARIASYSSWVMARRLEILPGSILEMGLLGIRPIFSAQPNKDRIVFFAFA